jgi:hypothetical protein
MRTQQKQDCKIRVWKFMRVLCTNGVCVFVQATSYTLAAVDLQLWLSSVHTQLTYQNYAVDPKGGRHLAATTLGPLHSHSCGTDFFGFVSFGRKQTSGSIHTRTCAVSTAPPLWVRSSHA